VNGANKLLKQACPCLGANPDQLSVIESSFAAMVHLHGQTTTLYTVQDRRLYFFMDSRLRGNDKIPVMPERAGIQRKLIL
jgi:hypothetical protein